MKNNSRTDELKNYLKRLNSGEDLEKVRADFVANFNNVEALEIMQAEQDLISEGTPLEEVQKLCDIHSALFHDNPAENIKTQEEVTDFIKQAKEVSTNAIDKKEITEKLIQTSGHPLNFLHRENEAFNELLNDTKEKFVSKTDVTENLKSLRPIITHYAKKGDIIYPHLKVKYGVSGPSDVMWTVDDEIRDELNSLLRNSDHNTEWEKRVEKLLNRMEEMIYKEENILFPATAMMFSKEDWDRVYQDLKDYDNCFGVLEQEWSEAGPVSSIENSEKAEINLPGGSLTSEELKGVMKSLPLEITFIDAQDINKYFNEGPKAFKRPSIALGHDVYSCHPPKVEKAVRRIIDDFKNGNRDKFEMWAEKNNKPYLVTYIAVRDDDGKFIGTMETVQDLDEIKKHFQK